MDDGYGVAYMFMGEDRCECSCLCERIHVSVCVLWRGSMCL